MQKNAFSALMELTALLQTPLAGFNGPTSKRSRGRAGEAEGRERKRKGTGEGKGQGRLKAPRAGANASQKSWGRQK